MEVGCAKKPTKTIDDEENEVAIGQHLILDSDRMYNVDNDIDTHLLNADNTENAENVRNTDNASDEIIISH